MTNGISDNIKQIAASINGLVGVAQQSQKTQEIQMLHICQKELEDTIEYLEASSMELGIFRSRGCTGIWNCHICVIDISIISI